MNVARIAPVLSRARLLMVTAAVVGLLCAFPKAGNLMLWLIGALTLAGSLSKVWRTTILQFATFALLGMCLFLAGALATDQFAIRYVWLYSSPALALYLKVANLWGGDEGTMLLLALFCMPSALRLAPAQGVEGRLASLIPAWCIVTAAVLGPFSATNAQWLEAQGSQGMNAHLQTFWMALHAPLILLAYAWALAPVPSAIAALLGEREQYRNMVSCYARRAWWLLTAGIGFGMVWALEDFTFGQLWHWDPVQTSAFILWTLLSAVLHGIRRWKPDGAFARTLPLISLTTGICTLLAMAVTRSEVLSSSHRYIGTTSWTSHLALASVLGLVMLGVLLRRSGASRRKPSRLSLATHLSVYGFVVAALVAAIGLVQAHWLAMLEAPKPDQLKPFFETLSNWASAAEMDSLRQAFARWDVDGHSVGRGLLPVSAMLCVAGGHGFISRVCTRQTSLIFTLVAAASVALVCWQGGLLVRSYKGSGVLSQTIVAVLNLIDAVLVAGLFLLVASVVWCLSSIRRNRSRSALRLTGSLALIHVGAVVALVGGLTATILNSYTPLLVPPSDDPGQWHQVSANMDLRVTPQSHAQDYSGYKAVALVEMRQGDNLLSGQALFQDSRHLPPAYQGPVRQLCELLDYRYARHAGDRGYLLHPFIIRGWDADVQVWVPATPRLLQAQGAGGSGAQTLLVVRRYPLVSCVWMGLLAMLVGMLLAPTMRATR